MGPVLCRLEAEALHGAHPNRPDLAFASWRMREVVRLGWRMDETSKAEFGESEGDPAPVRATKVV